MDFRSLLNYKLFKWINLLLAALVVLLIWVAFNKGRYFVTEPDECTYYNSARIFYGGNSIAAPVAIEGKTSIIGHCNWYGPMYSILYGSIAKIFGGSMYNFIGLNIFCLLCIILLVYRARFNEEVKLLTVTAFMSGYVFVVYLFQLYPEPLQILFCTILILQLKKIYDEYTNGRVSNKSIIKYTVFVLLFSTFRVTTVFWEFGLIAVTNSKKSAYKMLGMCFLFLSLVMVYMHYFNAPYNAGLLSGFLSAPLPIKGFVLIVKTLLLNTYMFVTHATSFYDGLYILLLLFAVYNVLRTGNRFLLSAVIIAFISVVVLLAFYVPDSSFLNKQTAYFYPLLLVPIFYQGLPEVKKLTIIMFLFFAPIPYLKAYGQMKLHKHTYELNEQLRMQNGKLEAIEHYIEQGRPQHILIVLDDINYAPYIYIYTHLPFSTKDGYPINYIENRFSSFPVNKQVYNQCFISKGNVHADYILSRDSLSLDSIVLVYNTNVFRLYRNNRR